MSLPPEKASELKQLIHQQLSKVRSAGGPAPSSLGGDPSRECSGLCSRGAGRLGNRGDRWRCPPVQVEVVQGEMSGLLLARNPDLQ